MVKEEGFYVELKLARSASFGGGRASRMPFPDSVRERGIRSLVVALEHRFSIQNWRLKTRLLHQRKVGRATETGCLGLLDCCVYLSMGLTQVPEHKIAALVAALPSGGG